MSVRVVARIRPLQKTERDGDVIVRCDTSAPPPARKNGTTATTTTREAEKGGKLNGQKEGKPGLEKKNVVRIPNPKNGSEEYTFKFNSVYDGDATQQELFDAEVAPTIKHLFNGFDITLFAYGVTGTGKTHTMRGGKTLVDRGVIPRLLSGIYRRRRKMEKDSAGQTRVVLAMSYYEIYNDKVFDLFEPVDKRTPSGLPLRDNGGKTVVVGLTERPCTTLKEFEVLYDQANMNRSTSATKLNAHSSRSHAVLSVKLEITTEERTRVSIASCIDLAGSEDNRRTENGKERMVESASINKSLFVLAQCVEAISKKQARIPYRESKMTRILGLGQNNGLTIMILNLSPVRSYHLDTLSSLNFANRTKKIEVRETENEPMFRGPPRCAGGISSAMGQLGQRQPLRPLASSINVNLGAAAAKNDDQKPSDGKPVKAFSVYTDRTPSRKVGQTREPAALKRKSPLKRRSGDYQLSSSRPSKMARLGEAKPAQNMDHLSAAKFEEMVEKKVNEVLAARKTNEVENRQQHEQDEIMAQSKEINEQMRRRLDLLEQRIEGKEDARAEGLSYLLMAKQHQAHGENPSALRMYQLAQPFFPDNKKLVSKIEVLKMKLQSKDGSSALASEMESSMGHGRADRKKLVDNKTGDYTFNGTDESSDDDDDENSLDRRRNRRAQATNPTLYKQAFQAAADENTRPPTPRASRLLSIINSRDVSQIKLLRGVGAKKAECIVDRLCEMDNRNQGNNQSHMQIRTLAQLEMLKGVGSRTVVNMKNGIAV